MKLRKFFAAITAAAIAASMAISASAATDITLPELDQEDEWGHYMDLVKVYEKVADIATVEITIKDDSANGCVNISSESTGWGWEPVEKANDNGDGTFTYVVPVTLAESDNFVKIAAQDWDESTLAEVISIVVKDASGNVLAQVPAADNTPTTPEPTEPSEPSEPTTPAEPTTPDTQTPAQTGAAAGAALALVAVAGAALVVSKKRG